MKYQLSKEFREKYKKQDIRIRNAINKTLQAFYKNSNDLSLHEHDLKDEWSGYKSIDIDYPDNNYRAIFKEFKEGDTHFAYFYFFGTHQELYDKIWEIEGIINDKN